MATLVARIVRSQLAAAFGNVLFVALGCVVLDQTWRALYGHSFVSPEKAEHVLASMHMTNSNTWWYAALTGVVLWFSSLVAGSIENWTAYRRIPRAIAEHPLGERIGRDRMRLVSRWFARDVSAYAGSIVLGLLLGLVPAFGTFTGLPIDVRHVTLSTGQVVLAAASVGGWAENRIVWPLGGVALMFFLNLGVSFSLALWVASRARGVGLAGGRAIVQAILRRLARHPSEFFWPPRVESGPAPTPGH
jgi:site-specific recombinase